MAWPRCCYERAVDSHSSSASSCKPLALFHDNSKSYMHGNVYLLDDIMGGFNNSRRGLIKIECHSALITIVRGTAWLVSLFRNRSDDTIYVYVRNGSICKGCYFSALSRT